jgi:hypothetical protein
MFPSILLMTNLGPWTPLLIALGIGAVAAALVFVIGRFFMVGRQVGAEIEEDSYNLNPRPELDEQEEQGDVFTHGSTMDRRQALRRGGNPVAVLLTDEDAEAEPIRAYVLDRSTGGLCLAVPEAIDAGTILSVRATNAPPTTPWVQLEVRNCRAVGNEFELGCKFVKTPPWSILLLFG